MSNVTVIPSNFNLPAEIMDQFSALTGADDLDSGVSTGFPVMSIKGAKWRIVEGGDEHPIYLPDSRDLAPYVKVVILRANAAISKTFYAGQYVEGSDAAPDCYSNDGITPAADSVKPQCSNCAQCPQNVWGSKISPSGAKIKACSDVRRVAILPAEDLDYSPILLRIPGASLADLASYGKALKQRGIPYAAVVTKLSFDPDAAFPKIMFSFDRVLTKDEMASVAGRISEPVVEDILGITTRGGAPVAPTPAADDKFGIPADAGEKVAAQTQEKAEQPEEQEEQEEAKAEKPKPTQRKAAPKTKKSEEEPEKAAPAADSGNALLDDIDAALNALDLS